MTLESWRHSRLIVEHEPNRQEIGELLEIVQTDLDDARIEVLSLDRRLACCYAALLTAARVALRASGYRVPKGTPSHHYYAIRSLHFTVGFGVEAINKMESLGKKRATADYIRVGEVSESMVEEALMFAESCCTRVRKWIDANHGHLIEGA